MSSAEKGEGLVTTPIGEALWQWGSVTNLRGLVSSFCIFNDTLSSSNFMTLYRKGLSGREEGGWCVEVFVLLLFVIVVCYCLLLLHSFLLPSSRPK